MSGVVTFSGDSGSLPGQKLQGSKPEAPEVPPMVPSWDFTVYEVPVARCEVVAPIVRENSDVSLSMVTVAVSKLVFANH
jgi:hypothetical protein